MKPAEAVLADLLRQHGQRLSNKMTTDYLVLGARCRRCLYVGGSYPRPLLLRAVERADPFRLLIDTDDQFDGYARYVVPTPRAVNTMIKSHNAQQNITDRQHRSIQRRLKGRALHFLQEQSRSEPSFIVINPPIEQCFDQTLTPAVPHYRFVIAANDSVNAERLSQVRADGSRSLLRYESVFSGSELSRALSDHPASASATTISHVGISGGAYYTSKLQSELIRLSLFMSNK